MAAADRGAVGRVAELRTAIKKFSGFMQEAQEPGVADLAGHHEGAAARAVGIWGRNQRMQSLRTAAAEAAGDPLLAGTCDDGLDMPQGAAGKISRLAAAVSAGTPDAGPGPAPPPL